MQPKKKQGVGQNKNFGKCPSTLSYKLASLSLALLDALLECSGAWDASPLSPRFPFSDESGFECRRWSGAIQIQTSC